MINRLKKINFVRFTPHPPHFLLQFKNNILKSQIFRLNLRICKYLDILFSHRRIYQHKDDVYILTQGRRIYQRKDDVYINTRTTYKSTQGRRIYQHKDDVYINIRTTYIST